MNSMEEGLMWFMAIGFLLGIVIGMHFGLSNVEDKQTEAHHRGFVAGYNEGYQDGFANQATITVMWQDREINESLVIGN